MLAHPDRSPRRDATANYERVLDAAREVFGERGADACMEEIAARAGVGVGTVYRRFASKNALVDELLKRALEDMTAAAQRALAIAGGHGLEHFLRAAGEAFADHARYADLLLSRPADPRATSQITAAIEELTARALAAGTVHPDVTGGDVLALTWTLRGLVQATAAEAPDAWRRYLDIHLAGLRGPGPLTPVPAMSAAQMAALTSQARLRQQLRTR